MGRSQEPGCLLCIESRYMAKEDLAKLSDTAQDAMSMSSAAAMEAGCT